MNLEDQIEDIFEPILDGHKEHQQVTKFFETLEDAINNLRSKIGETRFTELRMVSDNLDVLVNILYNSCEAWNLDYFMDGNDEPAQRQFIL